MRIVSLYETKLIVVTKNYRKKKFLDWKVLNGKSDLSVHQTP